MIAQEFRRRFGRSPEAVSSAPGRVNLIGEHTDYNDGFVLPMAIGPRLEVAIARRADRRTVAWSAVYDEERALDWASSGAGEHALVAAPSSAGARAPHWSDYVWGVLRLLTELPGAAGTGFDLAISGGVPVGAGLSSSAALEVATTRAACAVLGLTWDAAAMALLAQRAETESVGVQCGIMDQYAVTFGRAGHALLLDCRSLAMEAVALPAGASIVVMDTGVHRSLSASAYNDRRSACERVVAAVRAVSPSVRALRDVDTAMLDAVSGRLDATDLRRARHVIAEMARPERMAAALRAGDLGSAGALLDESHASLQALYEVSSEHLDIACDIARAHADCFGARMTGAGFGGCAIGLVRAGGEDGFIAAVQPRYEARTYQRARFFTARAEDGVRLSDSGPAPRPS